MYTKVVLSGVKAQPCVTHLALHLQLSVPNLMSFERTKYHKFRGGAGGGWSPAGRVNINKLNMNSV